MRRLDGRSEKLVSMGCFLQWVAKSSCVRSVHVYEAKVSLCFLSRCTTLKKTVWFLEQQLLQSHPGRVRDGWSLQTGQPAA